MNRMKAFTTLGSLLLLALATVQARAQSTTPPAASPAEPAAASPVEEARGGPKVTIHGFLSQAYARSDGGQILGIPEKGTADYRSAALQVRADLTSSDIFAIQLQHERFGDSVVQKFHNDVELDWLFYEHKWGDSAVKIGKVQIPFGIYNEVRDVGTLLPFFRPSPNFYGEGAFTSETVDGVVLSHSWNLGHSWQLDGDLHYGNWEYINRSSTFEQRKVRNSAGIELWLSTPVPGLRIGTGGMRYDVDKPDGNRWTTYHVSLEGEFGRIVSQVEFKNINFAQGTYNAGYARLGVKATDKITVNAQIDRSNLNIDFFRSGKFDDDKALGVNYAFRDDLVMKLEYHWNQGFTPEIPQQNFFAPAVKTNYGIVSLSTSF